MTRAIIAAVVLWTATAGALDRPAVVVLIVDGLDARALSATATPAIWKLAHDEAASGAFYPRALAVVPTVTNANHASLLTGVYPSAHGIVGNYVWERYGQPSRRRLEGRGALEVPSLLDDLARVNRPSAAIFGKAKLATLFGPEEATSAVRVWGDHEAEHELAEPGGGPRSDARTMDEALRAIPEHRPELAVVNLGDLDRTAHVFGPDSEEARAALLEADRQVDRLVRFLRDGERWAKTVLALTADHGFSPVTPAEADAQETRSFGRVLERAGIDGAAVVGNGGTAFVYLREIGSNGEIPSASHEILRRIRSLALAQPEIAEALYRLPNPADGGETHTLAKAHPDWRLAHPRTGELMLFARLGLPFADPPNPILLAMRGNHGGPDERAIPLLWSGGWAGLAARGVGDGARTAEIPDVGMTIRRLLGLAPPRDRAGREVAAGLRGRVLEEILAP